MGGDEKILTLSDSENQLLLTLTMLIAQFPDNFWSGYSLATPETKDEIDAFVSGLLVKLTQ